ncbi:MAG: lipocalin family protein, partial [Spirochaetia bacterium]|nr:lipocalin family protein [Spirochaetia bacterium]
SFIPGIWMKYRLIYISEDGNAMLVTSKKMKYLWIMSRLPQVPEETYASLVAKASEFGFDVSLLEKVPQ